MRMSHIYQPLMIRTLLDSGGSATIRQLATSFVARDEALAKEYEGTIKKMPLRVLKKHGVVLQDGDLVRLALPALTLEQRAELSLLCEQKMQEFVRARGWKIWDYGSWTMPVPTSLRYQVLAAGDQRCAPVRRHQQGAAPWTSITSSPGQRAVGPLWRTSRCSAPSATAQRGGVDDKDFRDGPDARGRSRMPVLFPPRSMPESNSRTTPSSPSPTPTPSPTGTSSSSPRRHTESFFTMTDKERHQADELVRVLQKRISAGDPSVIGFQRGNQRRCGRRTDDHARPRPPHPRGREGDTPSPKGGVRGVIPSRMSY